MKDSLNYRFDEVLPRKQVIKRKILCICGISALLQKICSGKKNIFGTYIWTTKLYRKATYMNFSLNFRLSFATIQISCFPFYRPFTFKISLDFS